MTVSLYAGLLGLMFLALSIRVIGGRRLARVGLGDGGEVVPRSGILWFLLDRCGTRLDILPDDVEVFCPNVVGFGNDGRLVQPRHAFGVS